MTTALDTAGRHGPSDREFIELRLVNGQTLRGLYALWRDSSGHPSYFVDQYPPFAMTPSAVVVQAIPAIEPRT